MNRSIVTILIVAYVSVLPAALHADAGGEAVVSVVKPYGSISIRGGFISLDVNEVEITELLSEIARLSGIRIDVGKGIAGRVSLKTDSKTLEQVMDMLRSSHFLVYEYIEQTRTYRVVQVGTFTDNHNAPERGKASPAAPEAKSHGETRSHHRSIGRPAADAGSSRVELESDHRGRPLFKPGELLLRFKTGVAESAVRNLHRVFGSEVVRHVPGAGLQQVRLRNGWSEREAVTAYLASGIVDVAERHAFRYIHSTIPNDTQYGQLWWVEQTGLPYAWDITTGNDQIVIAVIDTGMDYYHPDLYGNVWTNPEEIAWNGIDDDGNGYIDDVHGWDFSGVSFADTQDADMDPYDTDPQGHGTHVSGVIAAEGNNGMGVAGVNWTASLMPLKVQADDSDTLEDADIIAAVYYAISMGARIVNCSFGGAAFSQLEYDAFDALRQNDILAVCAAGNSGLNTDDPLTVNYPSAYDLANIIAVAASDASDNLDDFSNFGAVSVDVAAPGSNVKSTVPADDPTATSVVADGGAVTVTAHSMTHAAFTEAIGISGVLYDCGSGNSPSDFPSAIGGNIALIQRDGVETFALKVQNARNAGAVGAVIYNHEEGSLLGTLGRPDHWIPVAAVSKSDGQVLLGHTGTTVTLKSTPADAPEHYAYRSGTSMAAPHVTGIAGLLLSVDPSLSAAVLKGAIENTVDSINGMAAKVKTGGRVNARRALCSVAAVEGDLAGDGTLDLADAIRALGVLSGRPEMIFSPCVPAGMDVDGDGRIGLRDAVWILETAAGNR